MKKIFKAGSREIILGEKTLLAGILNVTPDSFSDGGKWFERDKAVERALELVSHGADMIDIGGESTRPGSKYVEIKEEIDRVVPVIRELKKRSDVLISVDTWKAEVARAAFEAGADVINDITGLLGDREMGKAVKETGAGVILMFNAVTARPDHPSSKVFPSFGENPFTEEERKSFQSMDILKLMDEYFAKGLKILGDLGVKRDRIMLDPGIGFGLTKKENLIIARNFDYFKDYFTYVGVSRKRFIVNIMNDEGVNSDPETDEGFRARDIASSYLTNLAAIKGVDVVRVHTIKEHLMARAIGDAVRNAYSEEDINFGQYK